MRSATFAGGSARRERRERRRSGALEVEMQDAPSISARGRAREGIEQRAAWRRVAACRERAARSRGRGPHASRGGWRCLRPPALFWEASGATGGRPIARLRAAAVAAWYCRGSSGGGGPRRRVWGYWPAPPAVVFRRPRPCRLSPRCPPPRRTKRFAVLEGVAVTSGEAGLVGRGPGLGSFFSWRTSRTRSRWTLAEALRKTEAGR